ncbi:MAG TPA: hypothetical protein VNX70_04360 [Bryobacteraceae bacterium]|nr:hypothetical protein [Bryobacteraceae bacterium]
MLRNSSYCKWFAAALLSMPVLVPTASYGQGLTAPDVKSSKPAPRTADGHPDLSGFWKGTRDTKPVGNLAKDLPGLKLPFTPAGEAARIHNTTATIDPESLCILGGIPRHDASGLPFEVLQGANKVAFLYWYSYFRLIPVDPKRKHSDDPDPSFFGEELGHWEGDVLVVDSIGFKDTQVWADENANPHSDQLHVVERWTRPDYDHIRVDALIDDPKFYVKPFPYTRTWVLGKPGEEIHEYSCSENNVDRDHLGFGPGPIRPDGTRGFDDLKPLPPPLPAPTKK